jgi:pyrroline-5-carboxylate reductase
VGLTAVFGAGVMGEAILSGLLQSGRRPAELAIVERSEPRVAEILQRYGVAALDPTAAAAAADTLLLIVKPQDMGALVDQIAPHISSDALVVSLAAGITTAFLEHRLPDGVAVVRVMPNTPALVHQGMAALSAGSSCSGAQLAEAEVLLQAVGKAVLVPEDQQDAVTAVSGSGPAYVFYLAEAMIQAGVKLGLPLATATELTIQTVVGAATMMRETGESPSALRQKVTSPAGTTAAAIHQLDEHLVREALVTALEAARDRSRELGA